MGRDQLVNLYAYMHNPGTQTMGMEKAWGCGQEQAGRLMGGKGTHVILSAIEILKS